MSIKRFLFRLIRFWEWFQDSRSSAVSQSWLTEHHNRQQNSNPKAQKSRFDVE